MKIKTRKYSSENILPDEFPWNMFGNSMKMYFPFFLESETKIEHEIIFVNFVYSSHNALLILDDNQNANRTLLVI